MSGKNKRKEGDASNTESTKEKVKIQAEKKLCASAKKLSKAIALSLSVKKTKLPTACKLPKRPREEVKEREAEKTDLVAASNSNRNSKKLRSETAAKFTKKSELPVEKKKRGNDMLETCETRKEQEHASVAAEISPFSSLSVSDVKILCHWHQQGKKSGWTPRLSKMMSTSCGNGIHVQRSDDDHNNHNADNVLAYDRYDIRGTSNVNELVLRHDTMGYSELKESLEPTLFLPPPPKRHGKGKGKGPSNRSQKSKAALEEVHVEEEAEEERVFALDRYLSNVVRSLVHPLHNFLQLHHGLHNADEVQIMLMPKDGPIAQADRKLVLPSQLQDDSQDGTLTKRRGHSIAPKEHGEKRAEEDTGRRRCYVATNNESLTSEQLAAAVDGWGVAGVFQISEFVLVTGPKGQHAEQKLLTFLKEKVIDKSVESAPKHQKNRERSSAVRFAKPSSHAPQLRLERADQKALVVGERLPCAACKLYSIAYEPMAVLLPSHGHLYASTMVTPPTAGSHQPQQQQQQLDQKEETNESDTQSSLLGSKFKNKSSARKRDDDHEQRRGKRDVPLVNAQGKDGNASHVTAVRQLQALYLNDPLAAARALTHSGRVLI